MGWWSGIPVVGGIVDGAIAGGKTTDLSAYDEDRAHAQNTEGQFASDRRNIRTQVPIVNGERIVSGNVHAGRTETAAIDDAQAQQIRARQLSALQMLQGRADGSAPSAAQFAYRGAAQDITNQQLGMAGQARGNAAISARRNAARAISEGQQRAALQMAQLKAGEMSAATGQLSTALAGVRDTDSTMALKQAQMEQETRQLNRKFEFEGDVGNKDRELLAAKSNQSTNLSAEQGNQTSTLRGQEITNQARAELAQRMIDEQRLAADAAFRKNNAQEAARQEAIKRGDNLAKGTASAIATKGKDPSGGGGAGA
jgi:hypothetical protein